MGRLTIFAGGYGSGKTEIALNFALQRAEESGHSILADLDLINPFFASRCVMGELQAGGVKLLASRGDLAFGDVPQLPPEIIGMIQQDNELFIDLGGDQAGSLVLGYLMNFIKHRPCDFYLVVNPFRPFASSLDDLTDLIVLLENASRMCFTGIISNPNLVEETNPQIIVEGHRQVLTWAEVLGLPVRYLTVEDRFYNELLPEYRDIIKKITLQFRPDWLSFS